MLPADIDLAGYRALRAELTSWRGAIEEIAARHGVRGDVVALGGSNLVAAVGEGWVVKLFPPFLRYQWEAERLALARIAGRVRVATPELVGVGEEGAWPYLVMTRVAGTPLEEVWPAWPEERRVGLMRELGATIAEVQRVPVAADAAGWDAFLERQLAGCRARHEARGLPRRLVEEIDPFLERARASLPWGARPVLLTGEYTPENLLVEPDGGLVGMIDFGDATVGAGEYDLLGPGTFLAAGDAGRLRALLAGYGCAPDPALRRRLMALLLLHRHSDLEVQVRIPGWRERAGSLEELEALIWPC